MLETIIGTALGQVLGYAIVWTFVAVIMRLFKEFK